MSSPARVQRVAAAGGERTWTVLDGEQRVVAAAEQYLECLRMLGRSPNTVKSYARALALWWQFLAAYELAWDAVTIEDFGRFLGWLRSGDSLAVASIERRPARFSESTIALRLQAVCSFYRFQHYNGVDAASKLYERAFSRGRSYKPMLEHLARGRGHERRVVRVARAGARTLPTLTPEQVRLILDSCARWDEPKRDWDGSVRDRLLWALLAETGMRLGETLAIKHCDWHIGLGETPFVEVVAREDHPHGLRVKNGGYRRVYISDELDRLYGEYLWRLCDAGADVAVGDLDSWWVFVNLAREPRFQPLCAETVAWQVRRLRRRFPDELPAGFTPHWLRHTHATALLLSGIAEHVVSRRLGHLDIQTTQNLYGWVSEDAEQRTVAQWQQLTAAWRTDEPGRSRVPRGNAENLRAAAQRKHEAAVARATAGLQALERDGKPVTFRGLAKAAGVSVDFLYRSPLRVRIEKLRAERESAPPAPRSVQGSATATHSNVVRALTAQIAELKQRHRAETEQLQAALAVAHGENLELRRQLGREGGPRIYDSGGPRP